MSKVSKSILFSLLLGVSFTVFAQANRPEDFRERYTLKQVVVLSRHNIYNRKNELYIFLK